MYHLTHETFPWDTETSNQAARGQDHTSLLPSYFTSLNTCLSLTWSRQYLTLGWLEDSCELISEKH